MNLAVPNFGTKNPLTFLREVRTELQKVEWPSRKQTVRLTLVVLSVSVGIAVYVGALDTAFTLLLKNLVQ